MPCAAERVALVCVIGFSSGICSSTDFSPPNKRLHRMNIPNAPYHLCLPWWIGKVDRFKYSLVKYNRLWPGADFLQEALESENRRHQICKVPFEGKPPPNYLRTTTQCQFWISISSGSRFSWLFVHTNEDWSILPLRKSLYLVKIQDSCKSMWNDIC